MDNLKKVRSSTLKDGDLFKRHKDSHDCLKRRVVGDNIVWADTGKPMMIPETVSEDYCGNCEEDVYLITEE